MARAAGDGIYGVRRQFLEIMEMPGVGSLWFEILVPLGGTGDNHGEFDPGSERTLAARLKHASRTARGRLAFPPEWRTGE